MNPEQSQQALSIDELSADMFSTDPLQWNYHHLNHWFQHHRDTVALRSDPNINVPLMCDQIERFEVSGVVFDAFEKEELTELMGGYSSALAHVRVRAAWKQTIDGYVNHICRKSCDAANTNSDTDCDAGGDVSDENISNNKQRTEREPSEGQFINSSSSSSSSSHNSSPNTTLHTGSKYDAFSSSSFVPVSQLLPLSLLSDIESEISKLRRSLDTSLDQQLQMSATVT